MPLPDRLVLGLDGAGNHDFRTWRPPQPPEFAGPVDLARLVIAFRDWAATLADFYVLHGGGRCTLSAPALEQLLTLAYQASFRTDEGRTTRARLFVPDADERRSIAHRFAPPVPLTPATVTRLGPTLVAEDSALVVHESEGGIACVGVGLLNDEAADHRFLHMPRDWSGAVRGLLIDILAPGELRVSDGGEEYTLRANEIQVHSPAASVAEVDAWHQELTAHLVRHIERTDPAWNSGGIAVPEADVMFLWSRVLSAAVRLRHGGALVVVPEPRQAPIQLKYAVAPVSLGPQLAELWLTLAQAWRQVRQDGFLDALEASRVEKHRLLAAAASAGHLSATDGCVVFDRRMTLHGFAGSIAVKGLPTPRIYVDAQSKAPLSEDDLLRRFGERHRSAFHLCKAHANTIVFVISQDGDLRVFCSDEQHVYFHDLLSP